ncbi:hypothetical protein RUND412_004656 [Rhizina undulata]
MAGKAKIFIGLLIYVGLFPMLAISDYWAANGYTPIHHSTAFIPLFRFQQLKHFLHLTFPTNRPQSPFNKLEPLAINVRERHYLPASNTVVDEMMVQFCSQSLDMVRIPSKPIPEVWYLATSLLYLEHQFNIYMDNYFTNVALFAALCLIGVGACGTVRPSIEEFPRILYVDRKYSKMPWGFVSGEVVKNVKNVLTFIWQDNAIMASMQSNAAPADPDTSPTTTKASPAPMSYKVFQLNIA